MPYQLGKDIHANMNYYNQLFKVDKSFDILCRTFQTGGRLACLYFINGFADDISLQRMLQKLDYALKFLRMVMLILTAIFGIWGYGAGIILIIVCVTFNKTISGRSYLYPLLPLNAKNLLRRFFRVTLPNSKNQRV